MLQIQEEYGYWPVPNDKQNLNKNEKHIEDLDLPEEQEEKISNLPMPLVAVLKVYLLLNILLELVLNILI